MEIIKEKMKEEYSLKELSKLIDKYLIPQELEKKTNAEVSTPYELRQEMLDKIPKKFWKKKRKVFEPCAGKGGFIIDIIERFMEGLKDKYPDKKRRYKEIIEECIYFSDINATNIYICKLLIDPYNEYKKNYNEGDTLELDIKKKWGIEGFDGVIGNPPYQKKVGPQKTQPIWNKFVKKFINRINKNGYILYVHPSGWRSPGGKFKDVYEEIMRKRIIVVNMNDYRKGKKMFGVGTNYDYYLIQNKNKKETIRIIDIDDKENRINIYKWGFIPSGGIKKYERILALNGEDKVNIIYSRTAYGSDKKWMSKIKNNENKYPCVYTITRRKGIKCHYSTEKKEHFGIPKIIWSNGAGTYPYIDKKGEYGLTQFSYAIVDERNKLEKIKKAMESNKFIKLMNYGKINQDHKYNYKIIRLMKKDFWKEFINENEEEK